MKMTKTEQALLHLLVRKLGGHSCDLIEPPSQGGKVHPGFSLGNNRNIRLDEIAALCRNPDDTEVEA